MDERLKILLVGGVIDEAAYAVGAATVSALRARGFTDDEMETFVTHLVISAMRIEKGECVEGDAALVKEEIIEEAGETLWNKGLLLFWSLPLGELEYTENELSYALIHMCAMLTKRPDIAENIN